SGEGQRATPVPRRGTGSGVPVVCTTLGDNSGLNNLGGSEPRTTPSLEDDQMTANETLVRKMVDCYTAMDADSLALLLHPESKHTAPGSDFGADMSGRDAIVTY